MFGLLEDVNVLEEEKKSSYYFFFILIDLYVKFWKLYELNVLLKIIIIIFLFLNFILIIYNFM